MKKQPIKLILLTIFISMCMPALFCQDIIYLNNGTEIKTKIIELTSETVKYKKFEQLDGPLRNIPLPEVFMIIYENGTREVFRTENRPVTEPRTQEELLPRHEPAETFFNQPSNQDLCFQGQQDASRYYTGYREAATWTGAATILGGAIIGIIPAIACSTTDPQSSTFSVPDTELLRNSTYYQCYSQEARRIKSKKVWTNFGIGVAVNVAVALLVLSAAE
jgi:hypothetical protein